MEAEKNVQRLTHTSSKCFTPGHENITVFIVATTQGQKNPLSVVKKEKSTTGGIFILRKKTDDFWELYNLILLALNHFGYITESS